MVSKSKALPVIQQFHEVNESQYELMAGGWLVLIAIMLRLVAACPASCVVCAKDVTLCHQLTYTVAAPVTTRVLVITDGYLSSVESGNLSLLVNLALLSLSRNGIKNVQEDALHGLTKLRTLLLEHNHISSASLADHTFSKLRSLQVLVLSNNALSTLRGAWFQNTRSLTRLQLDGNRITNLTDSSFGRTELRSLRHLDLSNNFISYIDKDAFRPLPQLQEVDLSRNKLAHVPDVFTPLKHLILLSLDRNQWSCTCDLHPLARFLRNYIKSSAHTLRNAKDLKCQPSTSLATAKSLLRLSETNCDSKVPNLTLVLKDRCPLFPGQDVALLTVLGFAGAVGLTCLGLVVFNWKLQQGKANEHTSENLCCRTFDESLCAHEARNYHAKGYCNCHLTQENEIKVMSIVGSRTEMPLLQENSHQATLASESTALDGSFRNLKGKDHGADSAFSCLDGRLLQSGSTEAPGNRASFNDTGLVTRYCPKRVEKLRNLKPGEVKSQILPQHATRTIGISGDTFIRRYATSASALARESLEKHLTNESWQPPIEKKDNGLQPHRQGHFITSSSSKPWEPEEYYIQKILHKRRSKYDDPCGLLKQSKPRYFQPNNSLICKYVPCDQFQDYMKENPIQREHSKSEKEQIQIDSAIEKFLMSEDNIDLSRLSTKIKKTYSPKMMSYHDPDLVGRKRLAMLPKTSVHWKKQENENNILGLKKFRKLGVKNKGEKWLPDVQIPKKKRSKRSDPEGKVKGQKSGIKLNFHPFRKVRVHPVKSFPELLKKHKQMLLPPKTSPKTSEKKANVFSEYFQEPGSSNYVNITAKKLPLKHAPKQTTFHKIHTKNDPPFNANNLSMGHQSSVKGNNYSSGPIPNGNSLMLSQSTPSDAEQRCSSSWFSTEQIVGETQLAPEVPIYLPVTLENTGNQILPLQHSRKVVDQGIAKPTDHTGQKKSQISEKNQLSLHFGNPTQCLDIYQTDTCKKCPSDQDPALCYEGQNSSHDQLGIKENPPVTKLKIAHQIVENGIMEKQANEVGKKLPNTETYDSSLVPWTQSKNNLPLWMTNSIPHQNRIELPKDTSASLSSQAVWHLTNSSEKGIDSTSMLPRDDSTRALEIKIDEREGENTPNGSKAKSSMLTWTTSMTLESTAKDKQQTGENKKSVKHVLCDSSSFQEKITVKDLNIVSPQEIQNRIPHREIDLQINSNMHDLREFQNIQMDTDNSAHRGGEMSVATPEVSLSPEPKDIHFEAENEGSLVLSRINEAENSALKPVLHPPSAEYANTSPLEAE